MKLFSDPELNALSKEDLIGLIKTIQVEAKVAKDDCKALRNKVKDLRDGLAAARHAGKIAESLLNGEFLRKF